MASYIGTYLREEIQAEAVTRNVQAFAEFLDSIALANGQEINYHSLASYCQVSPSTLKNYMQILEDTLIGFSLKAFTTIGEDIAIEIKSTELVQDKHLKGIRALKEENLFNQYIVVSLDSKERKTHDGIRILPWRTFLELLWSGKLLNS